MEKKDNDTCVSTSTHVGDIVRSKHGCYRIMDNKAWGKYLYPSEDPDGTDLTKEEINGIKLIDNFPKIPAELWSAYIELCFYMCPNAKKLSTSFHDSQLEVQVCLLRDEKTLSQWKIVVPKQVVSGVSVKAELAENIDIVTGEKYTQFPPKGWIHSGSSHSHNTMEAFYSSIDDKSELGVPGMHIVVGSIDHEKHRYSDMSSIVLRKIRRIISLEDVVDTASVKSEFHPDVLDYIDTVVSANRKFYLSQEKEEAEEEAKKIARIKAKKDDNDEYEASIMEFGDEDGKLDGLFNLDITNSDIDSAEDFPFEDDIDSIVNHSLNAGYSIYDVFHAVARASGKRSIAQKFSTWSDDSDYD